MVLYEIYWIRYFKSGKTMGDFYRSLWGIPVAGGCAASRGVLAAGSLWKKPPDASSGDTAGNRAYRQENKWKFFYNRSEVEVSKNRPKKDERKSANKREGIFFITGAEAEVSKIDQRKVSANARMKGRDIFYNRNEVEVSKNRPKRSERERANEEEWVFFITGTKWRFSK